MRSFPHVSFQVKWLPFFLAPNIPEGGVKLEDYLQEKYGDRDLSAAARHLEQAGAKVGIKFLPGEERNVYPSQRSHRLVEFYKKKDDANCTKQNQIIEVLFAHYFEQNADINSVELLVKIAAEVGLDTTGLKEYLQSSEDADLIVRQDREVKKRGIHAVPNFMISKAGRRKKITLSGGQPPKAFIEAFEEVGVIKREAKC